MNYKSDTNTSKRNVSNGGPVEADLALILKLDMTSAPEILSQEEILSADLCAGARVMSICKSTPDFSQLLYTSAGLCLAVCAISLPRWSEAA